MTSSDWDDSTAHLILVCFVSRYLITVLKIIKKTHSQACNLQACIVLSSIFFPICLLIYILHRLPAASLVAGAKQDCAGACLRINDKSTWLRLMLTWRADYEFSEIYPEIYNTFLSCTFTKVCYVAILLLLLQSYRDVQISTHCRYVFQNFSEILRLASFLMYRHMVVHDSSWLRWKPIS